jgi:hypothetical protein
VVVRTVDGSLDELYDELGFTEAEGYMIPLAVFDVGASLGAVSSLVGVEDDSMGAKILLSGSRGDPRESRP